MKTVMSGMRPTGRLHIGNYWGALRRWVELQGTHRCFFAVADYHMFTTGYEETARLKDNVREMVLDWLTAGLDPERCVFFQQSRVPQHAELNLLLSMVTPISWLENNPTYKEQLQELGKTKHSKAVEEGGVLSKERREAVAGFKLEAVEPEPEAVRLELRTHGFLGYPVLQTADIVLYGADLVPVGQDQLPHIEISREIVRRFNGFYGGVLVEPQAMVTPQAKVPGVDNRKMSKSYGNTVDLFETAQSLQPKVMSMYTDPLKVRAKDPGHPEGCVVYAMHKLYSDFAPRRGDECRAGSIGCVACKKELLQSMTTPFDEFRSRRAQFDQPGLVEDLLAAGSAKARAEAEGTMERVRKAMNLR
ncbi:MAG: tryptophan--tRNA ligase [Elusimicrobia bacterium]|nr:tryptophan--tRNA ligase [Elusimicrobiota bacterium]